MNVTPLVMDPIHSPERSPTFASEGASHPAIATRASVATTIRTIR